MKYTNIREEELKNKVGADWFAAFDTTQILGNIDFTVLPKKDNLLGKMPLLWAEAKTGDFDIATMFVQLILTIGKARTFDKTLPPAFLGAFDFKKIAFVAYASIQDIFYLNDFNWNVTPSNHESKEFRLIKQRIEATLHQNTYIYDYEKDENDLRTFIANNIAKASETSKIQIDKNNFIPIYLRWLETIKPIIGVKWDDLQKANILDSDFYLADLFVDDQNTDNIADDLSIRENLFVFFENEGYKITKENLQHIFDATISIKSKETYQNFWKRYKRPPIQAFQDYIIERRDLLVPQDIRERKGAFFTPRQWVELSQKYLADVLGEDWQEEYYIWDCAAGTGNLLAGLANKYNIWASTLDQADVNVMHERIAHGANLLQSHVFQFDFLNDDFAKLPQGLQNIINNEEERKKLLVYINPPYAEATDGIGLGGAKRNVSKETRIYLKYGSYLKKAKNELFAQFLMRIYNEMAQVTIAQFSTLKLLQSSNFIPFRQIFQAKLEKLFIVPANTFDNVSGDFPIGFMIWNTQKKEIFTAATADVYDDTRLFLGNKTLLAHNEKDYINTWIKHYDIENGIFLGFLCYLGNDFQHVNEVRLCYKKPTSHLSTISVNKHSLIPTFIYFAVRHCIKATWLNDRDQFLCPNPAWEKDIEFQNDCLVFTLFHSQNKISVNEGTNHWLPFTEYEVNASDKFASHFMTDFIKGKLKAADKSHLFDNEKERAEPLQFSAEATAVFDAGRELWRYYHAQKGINVNASLYDIREHFQGRNEQGRMNTRSTNEQYTQLIGSLRDTLKVLAEKIQPKVYEYGFLKA